MTSLFHHVEQHRSDVRGIEAMTIVSNHHFPRHSHDQLGFGMIAFGAQRSWSGVGQVEASANDAIFCNPGEMHDGIPLGGKVRGWRIIYFDPALINRELEGELDGGIDVVRPVARDPLLAQNFARLFVSLTSAHPDPLAREENLIRSLICILRRHGARRPPYSSSRSPSVAKAVRRLDSAVDEPVSLAELAALTGVSRFHLLRAFTREIGTTPHAYLIQRRVCDARQLLAAGEMPAQAAIAAGFADQSHMTRVFVRYLGITPARYRTAVARPTRERNFFQDN
jgi:AraC-like DNA-binding protein